MLWAKLATAVGLALLLVVGAWSTSRGDADVHGSLCLASGVSTSAASISGGHGGAPAADPHAADNLSANALSTDAALCVVAAFCCVALVLLLRGRFPGRGKILALAPRQTMRVTRATPARLVPPLTLPQLSVLRI